MPGGKYEFLQSTWHTSRSFIITKSITRLKKFKLDVGQLAVKFAPFTAIILHKLLQNTLIVVHVTDFYHFRKFRPALTTEDGGEGGTRVKWAGHPN